MNKIKEIFKAIFLKEDSLRIINEFEIKKIPVIFLITNIIFPFIFNIFYLLVKHNLNTNNVMDLSYFIMWNILINIVLFFSLWLVFFITIKAKFQIFLKAIIFMNLLQPIEVILSYTIDSFLFTSFFIIYDIFFVTDFIHVNISYSEITKKQLTLYVLIAFLIVFIFLCIVDNTYMLFGKKIF